MWVVCEMQGGTFPAVCFSEVGRKVHQGLRHLAAIACSLKSIQFCGHPRVNSSCAIKCRHLNFVVMETFQIVLDTLTLTAFLLGSTASFKPFKLFMVF